MSAEAKVEKLESLLARVQQNRHPRPESPGPAAAGPASSIRAASPTPMEKALSTELAPQEPELEIVVDEDDDEPIITIVPPEDDSAALDLDQTPTAPVDTPAVPARPSAPARPAAPSTPARPSAAASPGTVPSRVQASPASASGPVAKVVSRAAPRTFGELLDRTLALRPR